ncbi:hypothetical protein MNV49_000957 [Pseudohyphozyma bogoriensis]|nr:hypothetical protein MNV49_000957 [Pseudohyphozyma bogoriensis]
MVYYPERDLRLHLGPVVSTIAVPSLADVPPGEVQLIDFKPVASYSWEDSASPKIIVPGFPPIWTSRRFPVQLSRDSEDVYVDQNGHRVPSSPLKPLILAVKHQDPDFDFKTVDFVTDRNNLRKLLRWASGTDDKDFRIDVD